MNNHLNLEQTIDEKVKDDKAKEPEVIDTKASSEQGEPQKVVHKIGLTPGAVATGIGVAGIYAASKGVKATWNLVYPPKFKKFLAVGATLLFLYGVSHPKKAIDKVGSVYDAGSKIVHEWIQSKEEKQSLKEKLEEATHGKATLLEDFKHKDAELQSKDRVIKDYERENSRIKTQNKALEQHYTNGSNGMDEQKAPGEIPGYASRYDPGTAKSLSMITSSEYAFLGSSEKIIVVDKPKNKLLLLERKDNKFEPAVIYDCSTGLNSEPKTRVGDKATPEGFARIIDDFSEISDQPIFGAGGYKLDFPGKGWDGITINGTDLEERIQALKRGENCSNGSIILYNRDILDLKSRLGPQYIRVGVIIGDPEKIFPSKK